jgi:hypothetical protein
VWTGWNNQRWTQNQPSSVFVTGNPNKLREVSDILASGHPIQIDSRNLDRERDFHLEKPSFLPSDQYLKSRDPPRRSHERNADVQLK